VRRDDAHNRRPHLGVSPQRTDHYYDCIKDPGVLETSRFAAGEVVRRNDARNPRRHLVNGLSMMISCIAIDPGPLGTSTARPTC